VQPFNNDVRSTARLRKHTGDTAPALGWRIDATSGRNHRAMPGVWARIRSRTGEDVLDGAGGFLVGDAADPLSHTCLLAILPWSV